MKIDSFHDLPTQKLLPWFWEKFFSQLWMIPMVGIFFSAMDLVGFAKAFGGLFCLICVKLSVPGMFMFWFVDSKSIDQVNDLQTFENEHISILTFMRDSWHLECWGEIYVMKSNQRGFFFIVSSLGENILARHRKSWRKILIFSESNVFLVWIHSSWTQWSRVYHILCCTYCEWN